MSKHTRLLKIWNLCHMVRRRIPELAQMCEVSERTIYRDILALEEIGVNMAENNGWYLTSEKPLPQLILNDAEKVVLTLALRHFTLHLDRDLDEIANSLLNKLLESPANVPGISLESVTISGAWQGFFGRLDKAIDQNRWATLLEYQKLNNEIVKDRRVAPYNLAFRERAWYLVAYTPSSGRYQNYRLDRIRKLRIEKETFQPRSFDIKAHYQGSLGGLVDSPQRMKARFKGLAAEILKKDGRINGDDIYPEGESVILDTVINGEDQWLRWLTGFGAEVEILEPEALRRKALDRFQAALSTYRPDNQET